MSEVSSEAVEAAARAMHEHDPRSPRQESWDGFEEDRLSEVGKDYWRRKASVALTAALPYLVPEGTQPGCTGAPDCPAPAHVHGCYADAGHCDDPQDHESALSPREVPSAEAVQAAVARIVAPYVSGPLDPLDVEVTNAVLALFASQPTAAQVREQTLRGAAADIELHTFEGRPDVEYHVEFQTPAMAYRDCIDYLRRFAGGETKGGE